MKHKSSIIGIFWMIITTFFFVGVFVTVKYIGSDGEKHTPVMIHRACYGSLERFMGIITENYAGSYPLWLSPVQIRVLPVSEKYVDYAHQVTEQLLDQGLRTEMNAKDDRLGYKIREASMQRIPYLLIVGEKERAQGKVNIRSRDRGELGEMILDDFINQLEPSSK